MAKKPSEIAMKLASMYFTDAAAPTRLVLAKRIDAAADEKYKPLVDAVFSYGRSLTHDSEGFAFIAMMAEARKLRGDDDGKRLENANRNCS